MVEDVSNFYINKLKDLEHVQLNYSDLDLLQNML